MMESVEEMVQRVVARHLGVPVIDVEADQHVERELGLDPLDLVLIALRLEEIEHCEFPVAKLEHVETVGDLAEIVRWMRVQDSAPPAPVTHLARARLHAHAARPAHLARRASSSPRMRRAADV